MRIGMGMMICLVMVMRGRVYDRGVYLAGGVGMRLIGLASCVVRHAFRGMGLREW